jgi:hypothetical protein
MKRIAVAALALAILSGCGSNRMAQPIAVASSSDHQMGCNALQAELMQNQNAIQNLYAEIDGAQNDRTTNMLWGGMVGYMTSEDGSAARAEIGAYQARNTHLMLLMQNKGCWSGGQS